MQVWCCLGHTEAEVASIRDAVMNDPVRSRIMQFLERVPIFCTPAQSIDHLSALEQAGFQHFVVSGLDSRSIETFASRGMRPLPDKIAYRAVASLRAPPRIPPPIVAHSYPNHTMLAIIRPTAT